jgi:hypothetical protein
MNPYRLKNVFEYLTSNNQLLKKKLKLGTSEIPIPPKRSDVTTIEAINRFNKANPRVDTTNLKPLSVKHSNVRQSNVNQPSEGSIQSAFDTATRDAQFEGFPAPNYEKFKARYLKRNMKADGGRIGFMEGKLVEQGPNTGKIAVKDLKLIKDKEGNIISRQTKYFKDMETANAAIQKHKEGKSGQLKYKKSKKILNDPKLKSEFLKYSMGKNVTGKMIRKKYGLSNEEFFQGGLREIIDKDFLQYSKSQALKSKTIKNMLLLHNNKLSKDFIRNGLIVPDDIIEKLGLNTSEAATASSRLSQHYSGMDFGFKELKSIRRNSKSGNKLFEAMNKFSFGNPYKSKLYNISLQLIDDQLGNETGTFESLKKKASYILKKNKIKGFDINEIAGVTGTARTGVGEFSQFVDIMDSNLNQKQMAAFQAAFSVARQNILDNPNNFTTESKKINKLASRFEKEYGVKLPRIRALNEVEKYYSPKRLEELKNQGLDIKAASKKLKYTVQMPPGAMTINEFVDQSTPNAKKQLNISLELLKESNPEAAKKVTIALNSGLPIDDIAREIARIPGVKQFRKAFTALGGPIGAAIEAAFAFATYNNEISKGTPHATAKEIAERDASFGIFGEVDQARMTDLTNAGQEIGVNTTGFQELKTILDLEKKIEKEKRSLEDNKFLNEETGDTLGGTFNIEQQEKNIADLESQYKIQATKLRSSENFDTLFQDYNSAVEYLARKQYNKVVDVKKNQVYPNQGKIGSDFTAAFFDPIKSYLPQNLMETGLSVPTSLIPGINMDIDISSITRPYVRAAQKIPFIGDFFKPTSDAAKLSAMSQEEKNQRALDMNIVKQNYHPVMGTTMRPDQMEEYYENYFSKGGIASLTKTIPPESGPTPHGLPYVYNNVKKI